MIIQVQKLLNSTECPKCSKTNTLQLILTCNREEETCSNSCECSNCMATYKINIDDNWNAIKKNLIDQSLECDVVSGVCSLKPAA